MPVVVPIVAAMAGAAAVGALGATGLLAAGITSVVGLGVSYVGAGFFRKDPPAAQTKDRVETIRSSTAARRVILGRTRVSGVLLFAASQGQNNETLDLVLALGDGITQVHSPFWLADELSTQSKFSGKVSMEVRYGRDDETAFVIPGQEASWTADHRCRGVCTVWIRLTWHPDVFANGIPTLSFLVDGVELDEVRNDVWLVNTGAVPAPGDRTRHPFFYKKKSNPALASLWYLRNTKYGEGVPDAMIDLESFRKAADVCDEYTETQDAYPGTFWTDSAGRWVKGYTARYSVDGVLQMTASKAEILETLGAAMCGHIYKRDGVWRCDAGATTIPSKTIGPADLAGDPSFRSYNSRQDAFNTAVGTFISPSCDWIDVAYPSQQDAAMLAEDGNKEITTVLNFPLTIHASTAQRIARVGLNRNADSATVVLPLTWKAGNNLKVGEAFYLLQVAITSPRAFRVVEKTHKRDSIEVVAQSFTPSTEFAWTSAMEQPAFDQGATEAMVPGAPQVIEDLSATLGRSGSDFLLQCEWVCRGAATAAVVHLEARRASDAPGSVVHLLRVPPASNTNQSHTFNLGPASSNETRWVVRAKIDHAYSPWRIAQTTNVAVAAPTQYPSSLSIDSWRIHFTPVANTLHTELVIWGSAMPERTVNASSSPFNYSAILAGTGGQQVYVKARAVGIGGFGPYSPTVSYTIPFNGGDSGYSGSGYSGNDSGSSSDGS